MEHRATFPSCDAGHFSSTIGQKAHLVPAKRSGWHSSAARDWARNVEREGVGVEPTAAGSAPPATDFEDQGIHRDTSLPICNTARNCWYEQLHYSTNRSKQRPKHQLQITIHEPLQDSLPDPKQGRCLYHRATLQKKLPAQSVERFL